METAVCYHADKPLNTRCLAGAIMAEDCGHHVTGHADLYGGRDCWLPPIRLLQGLHESATPVHCGHQTV